MSRTPSERRRTSRTYAQTYDLPLSIFLSFGKIIVKAGEKSWEYEQQGLPSCHSSRTELIRRSVDERLVL